MATPNLLTIPVELRELIYCFLFSSYTIVHSHRNPGKVAVEPVASPRSALLLTCRQIHAEAWRHLPLNCRLHFRGTENLLDTLLSVDQSVITRLRHVRVRAFPFPLYADDKPEYYPTYYFANALALFPGLCLDELEVYDCWHGTGQGDGWRDVTTYMDIEALLKSDAWKRLTYITPCTDFIASGYDHRQKRQQQPEHWNALLKERDGEASGAEVKMWIVPLKQDQARDEEHTQDGRKMHEWSARPGHEVVQNWRLATPEQVLKGEVRIVATRGKRARAVQLGLQEKRSWGEMKRQEGGFVREGMFKPFVKRAKLTSCGLDTVSPRYGRCDGVDIWWLRKEKAVGSYSYDWLSCEQWFTGLPGRTEPQMQPPEVRVTRYRCMNN